MTLFFSEADVRSLLDMEAATELMRDAFVELSVGEASAPLRTAIDVPARDARALFMPAYSPDRGQLAVKSVMVHRHNPAAGLPRIHAMVLTFDESVRDDDEQVQCDGFKVVVDPMSLPFLQGCEVDYSDSLMDGGFKVKNPQAKTTCGCGQSFSS